MYTIYLYVIY